MSGTKFKATWTPAFHEIFVNLCLEQSINGNKPTTYFTKEGWRLIVESFYKKAGVRYEKKQIKNHWDNTKEQWKVWCKLIGDSSMKWDPETNKFGASDEDWDNHIQENAEAAQFRFKELQHTEKLEIIFNGVINSADMHSPTQHKRQSNGCASLVHTKETGVVKSDGKNGRSHDAVTVQSTRGRTITSEQSMSSSSFLKPKAIWTPALHKIFVDLCLEQTLKGNRPETHFTKEGWRNMVESFNKKAGLSYNRQQLKNHWDITKEHWKVWCKLIGDSSMNWDPETNKFGASDEDWANYIQENAEAAQFRFKELQHTEKLEIIFDGVINSTDMNSLTQHKRQSNGCASSLEHTKETGVGKSDGKNGRSRDAVTVQSTHGRTITSEQSMSSSSFLKPKAIWTPALHKTFVDLCLEQTLKGNRPETHFTKEGWRNMVESFNKKTGLSYNRQQLKNHWDITKEQWKVWCKLIGTISMKWDPNTHKFGVSEEDWVNYVQANPEAAQFRFKELHHTDKLEIIYDGTINTGETEPPIQRRRLNDSSATSLLQMNEPGTAKPDGRTERLCDAIESRSAMTVQKSHSTQGKLSYSIGECIECLDGMEEVEQGSDLYLFALDIFLKKEYREIFLQLKKPSVRIAWLRRLQSVGPPLH